MAIITLRGRIARALDFFRKPNKYFQIGGTAPWFDPLNVETDDSNPPYPGFTDTIPDVFAFKKVSQQAFVVQDVSGTISYRGEKWRMVQEEDVLMEGARWVYCACYLEYDEVPTDISYRKIGICTGVVLSSSVLPGKQVLFPPDVADEGLLEVLDYRTPIYRSLDQREYLAVILEF